MSIDPVLAAHLNSPLGPLAGARPPAPEWFSQAIAAPVERLTVNSDGAGLEVLAWGERGLPGLLLLHGRGAHAGWWSFLAPLLAKGRRVVTYSQSGMGRSDWRERYDRAQTLAEPFAVAQATGLYDGGQKPVFVGHSFGGKIAAACAAEAGERMGAAVLVNSPLFSPARRAELARLREQRLAPWRRRDSQAPPAKRRDHAHRIYSSLTEALAHFRLMPEQRVENLYIADYLARESLTPATTADGGEGFAWRFDPRAQILDLGDTHLDLPKASCPLAIILAGRRNLIRDEDIAYTRSQAPPDAPMFEIPEAAHHIMVDQPLALVAALDALLAAWP